MSEVIISVDELELLKKYKETKLKPETIEKLFNILGETYDLIHDLVYVHDKVSIENANYWLQGFLEVAEERRNDNR